MSHNAARKARRAAAVRQRELDEAYAEANRLELIHLSVAGDEILGSLVDSLVDTNRRENAHAAGRMKAIYDIATYTDVHARVTNSEGMKAWSQARTAERVATSEVALALTIPEQTAQGLIYDSRFLVEKLPTTMAAFLIGDFSLRHARAIVDHAGSLPDELVADFEQAILPFASKLTFSKFNQKARTLRERMDASTIEQRHKKSLEDREVFVEPDRDGMAWLHMHTSASVAMGAYNRITGIAEEQLNLPNENRTLTQLRADVTADLLLDGNVDNLPEYSIRPSVALTVPVLTMLGHKDANGQLELPVLEGYGPIDIDTAKRLAGAAKSWLRVLTHPETGATLSVGRRRHRVPADLRNWLRRVDGTCRKPGCNRPAIHCDIDHTEEFQHGGMTAHDNLAHLCAKHHAEKHHTDVIITHHDNGDIEWLTTSGRRYISEPNHRFMVPAPPAVKDSDVA